MVADTLPINLKEKGELDRYHAMILLDMIGDKNLTFTVPANSDPMLLKLLLVAAERLNVRNKIQLHRHTTIIDDHVPFMEIGIPAIDLIDFTSAHTNTQMIIGTRKKIQWIKSHQRV